MFYVANGNAYVMADDGTIYPIEITVKEKVTERREIESYKITPKGESVEKLPDNATSATIEQILGKYVITEEKPLTFDQAKHDEATSEKPAPAGPKGSARVTIKTAGEFLGVNFGTLGTFKVQGLSITGTSNKRKATGWDSSGDKEGYFIGLHIDGAKKVATANHPDGLPLDETGDILLLLGEESPTLEYIDVTDKRDTTDKYTVSVNAFNPVNIKAGGRPISRKGKIVKNKVE